MSFDKSFDINKESENYFQSTLPVRWLKRELRPDFYVDYLVELDHGASPSGVRCGVQLKGTRSPSYRDGYLAQRISTKHLAYYVDRSPEPVFLVVVDTCDAAKKCGYWVHTQAAARTMKDWRTRGTVTIRVPVANRLEDLQAFRKAIEAAGEQMQSVGSAAARQASRIQSLDDRFDVKVSFADTTTHIQLRAKESVSGKIHVHGAEAQAKFAEVVETGKAMEFSPGELVIEGSEVFRYFLEEVAAGRVTFQAAKRIPCSIAFTDSKGVALITNVTGMLTGGTRQLRLDMSLARTPMSISSVMTMKDDGALAFDGMSVEFEYAKWDGQQLRLAAHFDAIFDLVHAFASADGVGLVCAIDGNTAFRGRLRCRDSAMIEALCRLLNCLGDARLVATHLDLHPAFPILELLVAEEESIYFLADLVRQRDVQGVLGSTSGRAELPVAVLRQLMDTGSEGLTLVGYEACPPLLGCATEEWALQRTISGLSPRGESSMLTEGRDDAERVEVDVWSTPRSAVFTSLIRRGEIGMQAETR